MFSDDLKKIAKKATAQNSYKDLKLHIIFYS